MARKRAPSKTEKPTSKAKTASTQPMKGNAVFSLKITLDWIKPDIWRRVEVPDCTLENLHYVIQFCMPWTNSHLWGFTVGEERYGPEMDDFFSYADNDDKPAHETTLSDLTSAGVKRIRYTYDFGDSWDHTIVFEKPAARDARTKYPRCVGGARACPPDDCGGAPGYEQLLETLADKKHPDHKDMMEWAGGPIDPEAFNLDEATKNLQRLKLK